MLKLLHQKFAQPNLKGLLLATGETVLEEGNHLGDQCLGTVRGVGDNKLGKLLMKIIKELRVYT